MSESEEPSGEEFPLEYLQLLHHDTPGEILEKFFALLKQEDGLNLKRSPQNPDKFHLEHFVSWDDGYPSGRIEFLRWWLAQYERDIARKYDSLTGLYDRDHWNQTLKPRLGADNQTYVVVLGDIDHFKRFNDRYGHSMGDRVLEAVGSVTRQVFDEGARCVRYGGEEILVVDEGPRTKTVDRSEKLRQTIREGTFFEDQPETITLSLGVADRQGDDDSLESQIERADLALYSSKDQGRDQVTVFAPYMRHREKLYVWGFYRYRWQPGLRFSFGERENTFYLADPDALRRYNWSDDDVDEYGLPDDIQGVRSLKTADGNVFILGAEGNLAWFNGSHWTVNDFDEHPQFVSLHEHHQTLFATALNNQLYRLSDDQAKRVQSLPDRWDRFLAMIDPYVCVDDHLMKITGDEEKRSLPDEYFDFATDGEELVMSSKAGNLYVFDQDVDHWKQMTLPTFFGRRLHAREIEHLGNNFLIYDIHGRLFLLSTDKKSVPQEMTLNV